MMVYFGSYKNFSTVITRRTLADFRKLTKGRYKNNGKAESATSDAQGETVVPEFALLLRQLYRRSHPDLLRHSHPEFAKVNDTSMQLLNSVLSTIKRPNQYPPRMIQDIPFYLKNGADGSYDKYTLEIRTAGGECKRQLTRTFQTFFAATQLSNEGKFVWSKEYFPIIGEDHVEDPEDMM